MRKVKDAKDLSSNELIYFKSHAKATYMSDGSTVEDAINNIEVGTGADLSDYATKEELPTKTSDLINDSSFITINDVNKWSVINTIALGDIVFQKDGIIKTIHKDSWNNSLGTPVGVVVIPENFLPDGKARMVGLYGVDVEGNIQQTDFLLSWQDNHKQVFTNLNTEIPIIDNTGSTSISSYESGYLPSDSFISNPSLTDDFAFYNFKQFLIPSPYISNDSNYRAKFFNSFYLNFSFTNYNGIQNTNTLMGVSEAAIACSRYKNGTDISWYLPTLGELGFLMVRLETINEVIKLLNGSELIKGSFWSSIEHSVTKAYCLNTTTGAITPYNKMDKLYVRPYAVLN